MKTYCFLVFASCCILSASPAVAQIYFNDFEGAVGSEWSNNSTDNPPAGARQFLGQFGNQTVSLTLPSVPAGNIMVSFELFLIRSWDGNGDHGFGPDVFDVSVGGGPTLLHTTFANVRGSTDQAYPDAYPGGAYPERTGAAENDTLGYTFHYGDSVYNLSFTFPHAGGPLLLNFSASGLQALSDESWGLDNVLVTQVCEITIDIKPGSCPNPFNGKSQGSVPVAILGSADFDVTLIDPTTLTLNGVPIVEDNILEADVSEPDGDPEDCYNCFDADDPANFNCDLWKAWTDDEPPLPIVPPIPGTDGILDSYCGDGYMDLVVKFDTQALAAAIGAADRDECVPLILGGQMLDGVDIAGMDSMVIKTKIKP